jgi:phosphoribosyl 1,2-cyclic phosphodiesterase
MLEFDSISSSSAGNCYTVKSGACAPVLIDPGLPYKQIQKAFWSRGLNICDVAGACLSHGHTDHAMGAMQMMNQGIDCWASMETWKHLGLWGNHRALLAEPKTLFSVGDWQITPFDVVHDMPGCLGFLITAPCGESMIYMVDTCYSRYKFPPVKILAIECNHSMAIMRQNVESGAIDRARFERVAHTHLSLERLIDLLNANDLSQVQEIILLHLSDQNSDEMAFKNAVEKATGIPCRIASK